MNISSDIRKAGPMPKSGMAAPCVPVLLATLLTPLAGCKSIGPPTIARDRLNYNEAISDSWKAQVLLNLVKLRYMDTPIFLDVAQIVGGYTLQTSANVGGQLSSQRAIQGNSFLMGAQALYTDRPTITYMPLTGDRFLRGMLDPVPPASIFRLMQSGYAADFVLMLSVDSLNGLRNRSFRGGVPQPAEPEFLRVLELLRKMQEAGGVGLRTTTGADKEKGIVIVLRKEDVSEDVLAMGREVRGLLKLSATADRFNLVYSPLPLTADELAVGSRSILQMMQALATYVEVPKADVDQHRTVPMPEVTGAQPLLKIHCDKARSQDAFAAVEYRGHWFWVDDRDWNSKRTFSTLLFLFTLSSGGVGENLPLLTIPTS